MIQHGLNLEVNLPEMHLKNYAMLFSGEAVRYWVWYRNSMVLTIIQVILTLFTVHVWHMDLQHMNFHLKISALFLYL